MGGCTGEATGEAPGDDTGDAPGEDSGDEPGEATGDAPGDNTGEPPANALMTLISVCCSLMSSLAHAVGVRQTHRIQSMA